ncbi:MAG: S1-like domain-containing RNA-binding protein [Catalinimonas sp.]
MNIGKTNRLRVVKTVDFGVYLDGDGDEILLPTRYVPEGGLLPDAEVDVFIYRDSEDRLIATTERPLAEVDQCAYLEVKEVTRVGAFCDWGLMKDLLVPFREQQRPMVAGGYYAVYVYLDERTGRPAGSTRLQRFIENEELTVAEDDAVDLLILDQTDLGYRTVINDRHWGLLYHNDVFEPLQTGDHRRGFVRKIREENKVDVSLRRGGYDEVPHAVLRVMQALRAGGGHLPLHDRSAPAEIYDALGISKKMFKKAVGLLYRERRIQLEEGGIRLVPED